jgi:hypothetical protein
MKKRNEYPTVRTIYKGVYDEVRRVSYSPTEDEYEIHLASGDVLYAKTEWEAFTKRDAAVAELIERAA